PDTNLKTALLAHGTTITGNNVSIIDTNGDGEIQCSEATAYTGDLILNANNVNGITDATGIEAFTNVPYLLLDGQNLTTVDISNNTALTFVSIQNNMLTSLDVTQNGALETLNVTGNNLTMLDVSQNTVLTSLSIGDNNLSAIDLSSNTSLDSFFTSGNPNLTAIDFSNNGNLFRVSIVNSFLTDVDFTTNFGLGEVEVYDNPDITFINIANGNNAAITLADFTNSPLLTCIQIDSGFTPPASSWSKDASANYSSDCSLSVDDIEDVETRIYPNPASHQLSIISKKVIKDVTIYSSLGNKVLHTTDTTINVSNLPSGVYLIKIKTARNTFMTKRFVKL
ncbi:MAG: T9SS type A sorting domain-containing protein, partial [Bacteroidota bacterium]